MSNLSDPRSAWDEKEPELDKVEAELEHYVKTAKAMGDKPTIELTSARLVEHRKVRKDYRAARTKLDEAIDANKAAGDALAKAQLAETLGTTDPKAAVSNHHAVIVAAAAMRYTAGPLGQLTASASGMRERQSASVASTDRDVVTETRDLVTRLFEYANPKAAYTAADDAGRRATAAKVAWWPLAEAIARDEFTERLKKEKSKRDPNQPADYRRLEPYFPTADMLETCFTRRREGFNAERRRIEAQLQQMTGELENMGGAA
jgi:hypothetical protein